MENPPRNGRWQERVENKLDELLERMTRVEERAVTHSELRDTRRHALKTAITTFVAGTAALHLLLALYGVIG